MSKVHEAGPHAVVLVENGHRTLYHYGSPIARIFDTGEVFLHPTYWDYSQTTHKRRGEFLGENTKTTRAKIESGEYTVTEF